MEKKIIIGTRGSKLALIYANNAKENIIKNSNLSSENIFIKPIKTEGIRNWRKRFIFFKYRKRTFE